MKLKLIPFFIFIIGYIGLDAQYRIPRSSTFFSKGLINPGHYGLSNSIDFVAAYRDQWTRIAGAPKAQHIDASLPFEILRGGIGFSLENMEAGAYRDLFVGLGYSYHLTLGSFSKIGIGLKAGMRQAGLNGSRIITPEGDYSVGIQHNDNILATNNLQVWVPNVDFGVSYQGAFLELGAGIRNPISQAASVLTAGEAFGNQQVYAHAQYSIELPLEIKIKPFLLFWTDFTENQINLQAVSTYREKISLVVGLRGFNQQTLDALQIGGLYQFNEKFALGYIFDSNLNDTNSIAPETHEIFVSYSILSNMGKGKLPPVIFNPRYF